tara:strand:+ start:55620 stop:56675 length:1056 start_codon:yes stop_codon:yes gene_type:complete
MSKENALLLFRVDTRGSQGNRALLRCLILADAHIQRGGRVAFALQQSQKTARNFIAARGLEAVTISGATGSDKDLEELLSAVADGGASSVVIEGRCFGNVYLSTLASNVFTAVIEDDGERVLPVQLIINSSFSADERFYTCRADARLLLGPDYKLVGPEVSNWPKPEQAPKAAIERIFLTSSDDSISARALDALPTSNKTTIVTVLGSRTCPILDAAARAACARGYIIEQISHTAVTDALLFCDAAIVTSESMSGLIGFLGIPTLCLAHDREDARETQRLAEEGANVHLAPMSLTTHHDLTIAIENFLLDEPQRNRFGKRLASMVDGQGAERILDRLVAVQVPKLRILKAA